MADCSLFMTSARANGSWVVYVPPASLKHMDFHIRMKEFNGHYTAEVVKRNTSSLCHIQKYQTMMEAANNWVHNQSQYVSFCFVLFFINMSIHVWALIQNTNTTLV